MGMTQRRPRAWLALGAVVLAASAGLSGCTGDEEKPAPTQEDPVEPAPKPSDGGDDGSDEGSENGSDGGGSDGGGEETGARIPEIENPGTSWLSGWLRLPAQAEDVESILGEAAPEVKEGTDQLEIEVRCDGGLSAENLATTCTIRPVDDRYPHLPEVQWRVTGEDMGDGGADLTVVNEGPTGG
ncbi:hypothetical protein [Brachybacterium sp. Marseille-Q7125]|uniref:hypothetical protein n=1 Tax=Brachybacterium sp. Marseille-Q7125 TaxID=2932815 RepID=UPI001FF5F206|nr:hypothetical protein [Brachybacterium sp. Marseille-Q7125]